MGDLLVQGNAKTDGRNNGSGATGAGRGDFKAMPGFYRHAKPDFYRHALRYSGKKKSMYIQNALELEGIEKDIRSKRFDDAIIRLDRLEDENPRWASLFVVKANLLIELGEHDKAMDAFSMAIKIEPRAVRAFYGKATIHKDFGRLDEAEKEIDISLKINPKSAFAHHLRGTILSRQERHHEACQAFEMSLELDPELGGRGFGHLEMMESFALGGKPELAIRAWKMLIARYPNKAFDNSCSALKIFMKNGLFGMALECVDHALGIRPGASFLHNEKGRIFSFMGDNKEAIVHYTAAIELDGRIAFAYQNRGICHYMIREYSEAIADLDKALELKPSARGYFNRGMAKAVSGESGGYEKAKEDFEMAVRLDPETYAGKYESFMNKNNFYNTIGMNGGMRQ